MRATALVSAALVLATCSKSESKTPDPKPTIALATVAPESICVTRGELVGGDQPRVSVATFRGVARGGGGDAASLTFVANGESEKTRALASGQLRRQIGLKLRAENGCNLVYVMWRLDPKPALEVSIKRNAGAKTHKECGAEGYTKVKSDRKRAVPALDYGKQHVLRAEIVDDDLIAWIDGRVVWRNALPPDARDLRGPTGLRSDNLAFDVIDFSIDKSTSIDSKAKCRIDDEADQ